MTNIKTKSFGGCNFERTSPPQENLSSDTKSLNIAISFEEALKLNLALDECIRKLNTYNRSTKAGKSAAVNLCIHLKAGRIAILQGKK